MRSATRTFRQAAVGGAVAAVTALALAGCGNQATTTQNGAAPAPASTTSQTGASSTPTAATGATTAAAGGLTLAVDTVTTHGCLETNVFQRGADNIVWRIVVDKGGQTDQQATVAVNVKGGQSFQAPWNKTDGFYTAAWSLPFDAPLGLVSYTVTAKDGSLSATYAPQWLVQPAELQIVPYQYGVQVSVGKAGTTSFASSGTIPISAAVTSAASSQGKTTLTPLTAGTVTAALGLQGDVNAKGQLNTVQTAALTYDATAKAWTGSIAASGLKPGLYVVEVSAKDGQSTPNTGTGTSAAFNVTQ